MAILRQDLFPAVVAIVEFVQAGEAGAVLLLSMRRRDVVHIAASADPAAVANLLDRVLTALAVMHWNERRLPEQRTDLYESIITWLVGTTQ